MGFVVALEDPGLQCSIVTYYDWAVGNGVSYSDKETYS